MKKITTITMILAFAFVLSSGFVGATEEAAQPAAANEDKKECLCPDETTGACPETCPEKAPQAAPEAEKGAEATK